MKKFSLLSRVACACATMMLALTPLAYSGAIVHADEKTTTTDVSTETLTNDNDDAVYIEDYTMTADEQKLVDQFAEEMEFLYTYASTSDVDGNITSVNLTAIREKYGNSEFLDYLETNFGPNALQARGDFASCMYTSFAKILGLDIVKQVFSSQVKKFLAQKAWKKASALIVQLIGRKLGTTVLKKLVAKMVPGGVIAQVVYSAGVCGIKAII